MMLDLSPVINYEGKVLTVEKEIDFGAADTGFEFLKPVRVLGQVVNIGGRLELSATVSTKFLCTCDRCCGEFERDFECSFEEILKKESERTDDSLDAVYFEGNSVDLGELVLNNIIVSFPSKLLCREDCRGLCPKCGKDLNQGECDCDLRVADPRFDVLDGLFE